MFRVAANRFQSDWMRADNYPYALGMRNSGLGGGSSFFNRIEGFAIGIQTEGDNRHVLLRCDTLKSQRNTDYRLNPYHPEALLLDTLSDFGTACLQGGTANYNFLGSSYNVRKEVVNPVYYASGQPEETYPGTHNLGDDLVECDMGEKDALACPSLVDCWLVDCTNMHSANIDTLIEDVDTIIIYSLRMHALQEILSYAFEELDSLEFAVTVLETEGSLWAKRLLLPYYLESGQYSSAAQMLTDLNNYQGHPYDEAENQQYYKLYGVVYNTYTGGKNLHQMTATQRSKVEEVAQTPYGVAHAAQAIQAHNLGRRFHRIPDSSPSPQPRYSPAKTEPSPRVRIFPNPTTGLITVSASSSIKELILYDLFGRVIDLWNPHTHITTLNSPYPSGMYLLSIEVSEGYIEKHRLMVTK